MAVGECGYLVPLSVLRLHASFAYSEFPTENLNEKVPVTARWLQETGIDPLRLMLHKVEHSIHLTL